MTKPLKITDAHSQNKPTQEMIIELAGGSPWYGHIWLNDQIFTIFIDGVTGTITVEPTEMEE